MTMRQQTLYAFTLCTLVMLTGCGEQAPCGITVRDAWIREPPPRSPAAGYLVIENNCTAPVALVGAASHQHCHRHPVHGVVGLAVLKQPRVGSTWVKC